ncbi:hypothetical protein HP15_p187g125 (plasmid) [Marinobacter adhaerens HP15]|uniref:Uncharacterized protein n=1 Tax=Marinobacter adhaerens (strain DSM 23420 / HP15) TaxID=225937 RepID=E4PS87_MARAH|nr:hypothetical protein HP15_p187g125 [Marinobacter adhaerens HP15]
MDQKTLNLSLTCFQGSPSVSPIAGALIILEIQLTSRMNPLRRGRGCEGSENA